MESDDRFRAAYLADIIRTFRNYRALGEGALAQVTDDQLALVPDGESNSLGILVKHVSGNLRSRFTDFLTTDGEKPDRDRDAEFEEPSPFSRASVTTTWTAGWTAVMTAIESLTPDDLSRTVYIRREPFLVAEALNRSVTHTAYHVGQMVFLAKQLVGSKWTSLSIPKGKSAEYTIGTFKQPTPPKR